MTVLRDKIIWLEKADDNFGEVLVYIKLYYIAQPRIWSKLHGDKMPKFITIYKPRHEDFRK